MKYVVARSWPDGRRSEEETCDDFTKAVVAAAEKHTASGLDIRLIEKIEPNREDELIIIEPA